MEAAGAAYDPGAVHIDVTLGLIVVLEFATITVFGLVTLRVELTG